MTVDPAGVRPAVVLVGPPGSGKSSVGRAVARLTGLDLRDTDADIERSSGRSIPDIFANDGEDAFRALERAAVGAALAEHAGVLALGGGAVLASETRTVLAGHRVVFLALTMPTGVQRTGLGRQPAAAGGNESTGHLQGACWTPDCPCTARWPRSRSPPTTGASARSPNSSSRSSA